MVGINNGDAIFCIIMVLDSLARSNNSIVEIETLHTESCPVLTNTEGGAGVEMIQDDSMPDIISAKAIEHLSSCQCDPEIEAVFFAHNGRTLLFPLKLSNVKMDHPWLNDTGRVHKVVEIGIKHGSSSPLMGSDFESMQLAFRSGHGIVGCVDLSEDDGSLRYVGTVH
tara:strand:- start:163 stop:666 length:504 start_codon:yes stop_codon:yes gene_type:complete